MQTKTLVLIVALAALLALPTAAAEPIQNGPLDLQGRADKCKVVGNVVVIEGFSGTLNGVQGTWLEITLGIAQGDILCHGALPGPFGVTTRPGTRGSGAAIPAP